MGLIQQTACRTSIKAVGIYAGAQFPELTELTFVFPASGVGISTP